MKFILTLFYICCTSIILIAQPVADSLFQKLNSANNQQKADIYLAIAKVNWRYSTDSIYKYSKKALVPVLCATCTPLKRITDNQQLTLLEFEIWVTRPIFTVCLYVKRITIVEA